LPDLTVLFSAFCLHIFNSPFTPSTTLDTLYTLDTLDFLDTLDILDILDFLLQILPMKVLGNPHQFGLGQSLKGPSLFPIKQET
jgi:hypothetical protein